MTTLTHFDVWWSPEWKVWAVTGYDADGDQVGDSEWFAKKADAKMTARAMVATGHAPKAVFYTKTWKVEGTFHKVT